MYFSKNTSCIFPDFKSKSFEHPFQRCFNLQLIQHTFLLDSFEIMFSFLKKLNVFLKMSKYISQKIQIVFPRIPKSIWAIFQLAINSTHISLILSKSIWRINSTHISLFIFWHQVQHSRGVKMKNYPFVGFQCLQYFLKLRNWIPSQNVHNVQFWFSFLLFALLMSVCVAFPSLRKSSTI